MVVGRDTRHDHVDNEEHKSEPHKWVGIHSAMNPVGPFNRRLCPPVIPVPHDAASRSEDAELDFHASANCPVALPTLRPPLQALDTVGRRFSQPATRVTLCQDQLRKVLTRALSACYRHCYFFLAYSLLNLHNPRGRPFVLIHCATPSG